MALPLNMLIGELADRTGSSRRSLRYYQQQGLIDATRDHNGYRTYSPDTVITVRRVRRLLSTGIPVKAVRDILDCVCGGSGDVEPCMEPQLRAELERADERIDEHILRRSQLRTLIDTIHTAP